MRYLAALLSLACPLVLGAQEPVPLAGAAGMAPPVVPAALYIENLTWPEVRDAIAAGRASAIIYTGSTEQNGPHMALGKHNFVAHYVAGRIAQASRQVKRLTIVEPDE